MKTLSRTASVLALLAVLASPALAWGTIRLSSPLTDALAEELRVGDSGDDAYEAQESVHAVVTEATGIEIPHEYLHVCLGDECVPIDPIRFSR